MESHDINQDCIKQRSGMPIQQQEQKDDLTQNAQEQLQCISQNVQLTFQSAPFRNQISLKKCEMNFGDNDNQKQMSLQKRNTIDMNELTERYFMNELTERYFLPKFDKKQIGAYIGQGAFGRAFQYQTDMCVKVIETNILVVNELKKINDELKNLCFVQNLRTNYQIRGISLKTIPFHGFHFIIEFNYVKVYLVFKLANSTLKKHLEVHKLYAAPFLLVRKWMVDLAVTQAILHNNGIVHRDLKSDNAMILECQDPNPYKHCDELYLSDFGESKVLVFQHGHYLGQLGVKGTIAFFSPELFFKWDKRKGLEYPVELFKNDMYSLGPQQFSIIDVKRENELNEDPKTWDDAKGKMGPNHAIWESFLIKIIDQYAVTDYHEDPALIEEFANIIRAMLTYRMDRRPLFKDLLFRMPLLFYKDEIAKADPVYTNLMNVIHLLEPKNLQWLQYRS